jgi:hypothetical protein
MSGTEKIEPTLLAIAGGASVPEQWLLSQPMHWTALMLPMCLQDRLTQSLIDRFQQALIRLRGVRLIEDPKENQLDGSLRGWAWVEGTFSWVEPTAYALISSRVLGDTDSDQVCEGRAMLLDRRCADGGWNFGNKEVLGMALPSDRGSTSWALRALG